MTCLRVGPSPKVFDTPLGRTRRCCPDENNSVYRFRLVPYKRHNCPRIISSCYHHFGISPRICVAIVTATQHGKGRLDIYRNHKGILYLQLKTKNAQKNRDNVDPGQCHKQYTFWCCTMGIFPRRRYCFYEIYIFFKRQTDSWLSFWLNRGASGNRKSIDYFVVLRYFVGSKSCSTRCF